MMVELPSNRLRILCFHWEFFELCQLNLYQSMLLLSYIYVFAEVMLVFGFSIHSISRICAHFPFWSLRIIEFVGDVVVGPLRSLFAVAVYNRHFLSYKLFWLGISSGRSKWELRSRWFFTLVHAAKGRVDLSIREFDEILISVYFLFFLLFLWRLGVSHLLNICVTL